ncbi:site-specific integrase [Paenibacillus dendritiformis]|uniref:site-specific integrase n=1 Tax=Paenibacillus TaxID=44249 RepID=UPI001B03AF00|nr:site-specific integrase [Paenibacillus dendritiformis]MEB9897127.1 site-specific integrase [Bacillus cereus]GIO81988.1 site-specific integrase [Paenibacillus dendritiformis]
MADIEKRGKNSYRLTVTLPPDENGIRGRERKTVKAKNKTEAEKLWAIFAAEVYSGEYVTPGKITFKKFALEEWLPNYAQDNYSKPNLKAMLSRLEQHVFPKFGHKKISDITTIQIVNFMSFLKKPEARKDGKSEPLSGSTRLNIYKALKSVLDRAKEWDVISKNPIDDVKPPTADKVKINFYDSDEAKEVIELLSTLNDTWRLYFIGSILGGFRRGELTGLEWPQVNFHDNYIDINQALVLTENGQPIIDDTKTDASDGIVSMPAWYMRELQKYYFKWLEVKMALGNKWLGGDRQFVFHSGAGKPYHFTTPTGTWSKFLKRNNLRHVRLHDLRHTSASLLIESLMAEGVDKDVTLKLVQERLRHSKLSMTADTYTHVTKKMSQHVIKSFDSLDPSKKRTGTTGSPQFHPNG